MSATPSPFDGLTPDQLRCQYPSKRCENPRTTKRGGGLHRLCEFHRRKANKTQLMVDWRKRQRQQREAAQNADGDVDESELPMPMPSPSSDAPGDFGTPLSADELKILQALLFDDESEEDDAGSA